MFTGSAPQPRLRGAMLYSRFVYGPAWSATGAYIDYADEQAKPFIWTAAVNAVMAKIRERNVMYETLR